MIEAETMACPLTGEPLKRANAPRPDWKMPAATKNCIHYVFDTETDEVSHQVKMIPGCMLEGDGWMLFFYCPECADEFSLDGLEIDWPFEMDEFAKPEDLTKLGFTEVGE